ncbi:MAG: hypothetical protein M3Q27_01745 [Actinomycetota bacterium]|nr:hypothetical protein [Actinomycetota bacterium]
MASQVVAPQAMEVRRRSRTPAALGAAVVVLAGLAWWGHPEAFGERLGVVYADTDVGRALAVGAVATPDEPVTIFGIRPVTSPGLDATLSLCTPVPGADRLGGAAADRIGEHCSSLEPVGAGTRISSTQPDGSPEPYVVAVLTRREPGPQFFCGVDVVYRSGLRVGLDRSAGSVAAVLGDKGDDEDYRTFCG